MKQIGMWLGGLLLVLGLLYFFPWSFTWNQERSVTVVGEASSQEANQIASYNAGVTAVGDNKDAAIKEVNEKVSAMIESLKTFGIEDKDIKTSNLNIYQNQESFYEEGSGAQKQRLGQWNVSNTVEIKLRDAARASELTELLSSSGANNVWGPNFTLDESANAEDDLMEDAIANAREKAVRMAEASGARLGKVLQVSEGTTSGNVTPFYRMEGAGGGAPMEPGSTMVTKMVTVTFELK